MKSQLFFIAIIPPKEIRTRIFEYKTIAKEKFNSERALNSPAHITLIPPFHWPEDRVSELEKFVFNYNSDFNPIYIEINGFDSFAPKVIFAKIEESLLLDNIQRKLEKEIHDNLAIGKKSHFPFHAHMTVAFKDLKKEVFNEAWSFYKNSNYKASFVCDQIVLLKFNTPKWEIVNIQNKGKTYVIYKPFGMLSQFKPELEGQIGLNDLDFNFPKDVYPVGRLDADSEGLLILSNKKGLNATLLDPKNKIRKTYLAQVEGIPSTKDLDPISTGFELKIKGKAFITAPGEYKILDSEPELPERNPPIRFRVNKPTSWVSISISEGKNRQVRKMMAKLGFPVLRLVRVEVGEYKYGMGVIPKLMPGEVVSV